jgi:hypothetical protein
MRGKNYYPVAGDREYIGILGPDFNGGAGIDLLPHDVHVFLGEGNTSVRPVEKLNDDSKPFITIVLAVDHDLTTGIDTALLGLLPVLCDRV